MVIKYLIYNAWILNGRTTLLNELNPRKPLVTLKNLELDEQPQKLNITIYYI